jgi:outer membrane immunogenic protein
VVPNDPSGANQIPRFDLGGTRSISTGFNLQNGKWVFGYEADSSVTNRGAQFEFPPNAAFSNEVKERWLSTFRGRLGFGHDNWLVYATAGGALGGVQGNFVASPGQFADKQWYLGWAAGGGVELKLTQDWTAKVEYLYVGLQDKAYFTPAPSAFQSSQRTPTDDHILRFGVNYKLPWGVLDDFFKR